MSNPPPPTPSICNGKFLLGEALNSGSVDHRPHHGIAAMCAQNGFLYGGQNLHCQRVHLCCVSGALLSLFKMTPIFHGHSEVFIMLA